MQLQPKVFAAFTIVVALASFARAEEPPAPSSPKFDAGLATSVGADEYGMRNYILVILKSGPTPVPAGKARDEMFRGHMANIQRLSAEGKLALAGPFDDENGWRGLFIFAVDDIEAARRLVATDPVIASGEMVAEFHKYYGTAALMLIPEAHKKVAQKSF